VTDAGGMLSAFQIAALFLGLVAVVGIVNHRTLKLPPGVAMLLAGLIGALSVRGFGLALPQFAASSSGLAQAMVAQVNFQDTVLGYMLAFLLFAGAMQVDFGEMRRRRLAIFSLATAGVLASTVIVGLGVHALASLLKLPLSLPYAFVFATLISATDPVAVLATVKHGGLSPRLTAVLQGEALFNDGVAIVVFTAALAFATGAGAPHPVETLIEVGVSAFGGLAIGLAGGAAAVVALRRLDDYPTEAAVTLACAMGVYALANALHVSGAIGAVAAGLLVGDRRIEAADLPGRNYLRAFWILVDELLNAQLFLILGLQVLVLPFDLRHWGLWLAAIPLILLARLVSVLPWGAYFHLREEERGANAILTWGGLRGALSLALAFSLPPGAARDAVISLTYAVVIFSVVVQGLSFRRLAARWRRMPLPEPT